jgi:hypothetical protein
MMPSIRIGDKEYAVAEISEGGLRLRCQNRSEFAVGETISGEIVFVDGDTMSISGVLLRRDLLDFVIAPIQGISFSRIVQEQRKVLSNCPSVRGE